MFSYCEQYTPYTGKCQQLIDSQVKFFGICTMCIPYREYTRLLGTPSTGKYICCEGVLQAGKLTF